MKKNVESEEKAIMEKNICRILSTCGGLKEGEKILIISDDRQEPEIFNTFYTESKKMKTNPILLVMPTATPGKELPEIVAAAAMEADLIVAPTTTSIYHSPCIYRACKEGNARFIALSECVRSNFLEGGITADFKRIKPIVDIVGEKYQKGKKITYSTPSGTRITADIEGRNAYLNSGLSTQKNEMTGLPTIEVYIAPVEESVEGTIVVDASCSGGVGLCREPIVITVTKGKAVEITGGEEAEKLKDLLSKEGTDSVYQVAELAIGLNPNARITGIVNEDEGKYGTCHMALGRNASFGGLHDAPIHIDMVQYAPTIVIDGEEICRDGKLSFVDF